jgi:hypothetical protein
LCFPEEAAELLGIGSGPLADRAHRAAKPAISPVSHPKSGGFVMLRISVDRLGGSTKRDDEFEPLRAADDDVLILGR